MSQLNTASENFSDYCRNAVRSFLQTVVVIDNTPRDTPSAPPPEKVRAPIKRQALKGLAGRSLADTSVENAATNGALEVVAAGAEVNQASSNDIPVVTEEPTPDNDNVAEDIAPTGDSERHAFRYVEVMKAFSKEGLICGSYYPTQTSEDSSSDYLKDVSETGVSLSKKADALILDWHLRDGSGDKTDVAKEIVSELLRHDKSVGGRIRLVIIYTGESGLLTECQNLLASLKDKNDDIEFSMPDEGKAAIEAPNVRIRFLKKPTSASLVDVAGDEVADWNELPHRVLEEFTVLSSGLLRNFALHSISAIRNDTHHILSMFAPALDGAFFAHKSLSPTPDDADELALEVLSSDISTSIREVIYRKAALTPSECIAWLETSKHRTNLPTKIKVKPAAANEFDFLEEDTSGTKTKLLVSGTKTKSHLVTHGFSDKFFAEGNSEKIAVERKVLFQSLYEDDATSEASNHRFSELSSFSKTPKRWRHGEGSSPLLTTGTVVRKVKSGTDPSEQIMLCVQPRCDSVRLKAVSIGFPFLPLSGDPQAAADLIVMVENGEMKKLALKRLPHQMSITGFTPANGMVTAVYNPTDKRFEFTESAGHKWEWLGELRELHAQKFIAQFVEKFNRVGINGSEWNRTLGGR